jgi:hypothetical protein
MALKNELANKDDLLRRYFPDKYRAKQIEHAEELGRAHERGRIKERQKHAGVPPTPTSPEFSAGSDYRTVRFRGEEHHLTQNQSVIIKMLHEAYLHGTRAVGKLTLLKAIEAETSRVRDSFKRSPLWGTLILSNRKPRGTYQLNLK